SGENPHIVLVVDGGTLTKLEQHQAEVSAAVQAKKLGKKVHATHGNGSGDGDVESGLLAYGKKSLLQKFLDVGITCDNVICCRFSPSQKALIVTKVRQRLTRMAHVPTEEVEEALLENLEDDLNAGGGQYQNGVGGAGRSSSKGSAGARARKRRKEPTLWRKFLIKTSLLSHPSGVTLAIGDGANDIPMIQAAHVGIGITGREGLAAARTSDYSIAQFRFLQPLLFVHGRWNYVRISLFTLGTFYKCVAFYVCQGIFQFWTGFSGTSIFEQWTLALYNILFSSLPVLAVGIFEKDINRSTLMEVPELYRYGQENLGFNFRVFWRWMLQGLWHAVVAVLVPAIMYSGLSDRTTQIVSPYTFSPATTPNGSAESISGIWNSLRSGERNMLSEIFFSDGTGPFQETSIYVIGTITYTITILLITLKISYIESHNWTLFTHLSALASLAAWVLYQWIYSNLWPHLRDFGYDSKGMWFSLTETWIRSAGLAVVGA
ncbi:hypothetical protein HK102_011029, partial [Quaeritorhiza haematococci]